MFKKETNGEKDNIVIALNLSWILLARNQGSHSDTLLPALSPCRKKCSTVYVDKSEREFTHEREEGLGFSVSKKYSKVKISSKTQLEGHFE